MDTPEYIGVYSTKILAEQAITADKELNGRWSSLYDYFIMELDFIEN